MRNAIRVLSAFAVVLLVALIAVPSAQIVMRGLLRLPFIGAEELTRFLLICLVFVSYPLVVEAGENIVMGELRRAMPRPVRAVLNVAISVSAVAVTGFMAYVTFINIFNNLNNATPTLGIPFWIFLAATFFGFAGAAIVHLIHLRKPPQAETNISI
jgi:TRAP-type C4-dicarboxylate transport system permease small subunit